MNSKAPKADINSLNFNKFKSFYLHCVCPTTIYYGNQYSHQILDILVSRTVRETSSPL